MLRCVRKAGQQASHTHINTTSHPCMYICPAYRPVHVHTTEARLHNAKLHCKASLNQCFKTVGMLLCEPQEHATVGPTGTQGDHRRHSRCNRSRARHTVVALPCGHSCCRCQAVKRRGGHLRWLLAALKPPNNHSSTRHIIGHPVSCSQPVSTGSNAFTLSQQVLLAALLTASCTRRCPISQRVAALLPRLLRLLLRSVAFPLPRLPLTLRPCPPASALCEPPLRA